MFTVIIQTTVFCLLTLCRTIPKYSNVYFYIFCEKQNFWIRWVLTGGAMCEVQNLIFVKPFTLFTETLTFYFQKCLGIFFLNMYPACTLQMHLKLFPKKKRSATSNTVKIIYWLFFPSAFFVSFYWSKFPILLDVIILVWSKICVVSTLHHEMHF